MAPVKCCKMCLHIWRHVIPPPPLLVQKKKKISGNFLKQWSLYRRCSDIFWTCRAREWSRREPSLLPSQLHSRSNGTVTRKYITHLWHVFNGPNPRYKRPLFQHLTGLTTEDSTVQRYVMATVMVPTWTFFVPGAGLCLFSDTNCASSTQRLGH